jgi:transposase
LLSYAPSSQKEGESSLKVKKDGRPKGSGKVLSQEQERQIIRLLIDKISRELIFPFALWTWESIRVLIERTFGISMPLSTVELYLQRWQFSSRKLYMILGNLSVHHARKVEVYR